MMPSLWTRLKGSAFVLAEGSGYKHNVIVGARDEGCTQAEDAFVLLMPDQVPLTHISGAEIRMMTRKSRQGDTATDPMLINNIESQKPPRQSTQITLESALHKQQAKQSAAKRHEQDKQEPAAAKPTHCVRKRTNSISKACTEQHKCNDIRSFWCKNPKQEQPKAAAALTANKKEQQAKKARTEVTQP